MCLGCRAGQGWVGLTGRWTAVLVKLQSEFFFFFFFKYKDFPKCLMVQKAEEFSPAIGHSFSLINFTWREIDHSEISTALKTPFNILHAH